MLAYDATYELLAELGLRKAEPQQFRWERERAADEAELRKVLEDMAYSLSAIVDTVPWSSKGRR